MAWNPDSLLDFFFYRGERVGRHGNRFFMWKLRTMVRKADKTGGYSVSADDARVTGIGRILRMYHLDEFPNLINVIKGDMAIFGPRPEVPYYVEKMSPEEREVILSVKPGCVDLATFMNLDEGKQLEGKEDPEKYYEEVIWPLKKKKQIESIQSGFWISIARCLGSGFLKKA